MTDSLENQIAALLAGDSNEHETENNGDAGSETAADEIQTDSNQTDSSGGSSGGDEQRSSESGQEAAAGDEAAGSEQASSKTLAGLAEKLGVDSKDLYSVEVPTQALDEEGNPITATLGELKDAYAEMHEIDVEREAVADLRRENERDLLTARQELEAILSMAPQLVTPEMVQLARTQQAALAQREAAKVKELIPSWSDETAQREDREQMRDHARKYGFREAEISAIFDSRLIMLLRDATKDRQTIDAGRHSLEEARKRHTSRKTRGARGDSQKRQQQARMKKAKSGSTEEKVSAVASLIG